MQLDEPSGCVRSTVKPTFIARQRGRSACRAAIVQHPKYVVCTRVWPRCAKHICVSATPVVEHFSINLTNA